MKKTEKLIFKRALIAFKCLPFNYRFYEEVKFNGLNAKLVFREKNLYIKSNIYSAKSVNSIETDFEWLIILGILRREVDGQGLTSKVRLTPLGRQIIEINPNLLEIKPSFIEKIMSCLNRLIFLVK